MALSFDATYYMSARPDVLTAYIGAGAEVGTGMSWAQFAEQHYNDFGWKEGYNPNAIFNTSEYLAANIDVLDAGVNPFQHYLQFGAYEKRAPSDSFISFEDFDWETYLAANSDLTDAGILTAEAAYGHYVVFGQFEVRDGKPEAPVPSVPGVTYTLTNGLDEFPGTVNDDTFQGFIQHLRGFDNLNGGGGHDVLNLHGNQPVAVPATVKVEGIETINIIGDAGTSGAVNASSFKGATQVWQVGRAGNISGLAEGVTAGFSGSAGNTGGTAHIVSAAAAATSVSIALDEAGAAAAPEFAVAIAGAKVTTVNISGTVADDGKLSFTNLPTKLKTLNLALDSDSEIAAYAGAVSALKGVTTLNASESTGDLTVGLSNASLAGMKAEIISLGSGNDTVVVANANFGAEDVAIDLGAGHDKLEINLSQNAKNNLTITTGAGEDVVTLRGGNITINADNDGFDGSVSITDFSSASDALRIEYFNGFTAQNLINAAIATAESLYEAVNAVAGVIGGVAGSNITNFAKFVFDGNTYIYSDVATTGAGLDDGDLLIGFTGVVDLNNDNVAIA